MNRNIIYTILLIFIVATVFLSYGSITTKLENTKLTQVNTKSQPCPDYWIYDVSTNKCYDSDGTGVVDFSNYTFCEKQEYSKNIENPDDPIPWNGISNVYNPRCEVKEISQNNNTPVTIEKNYEYNYIHYVLFYSLLFMIILQLEYVFGERGTFLALFFIILFIDVLLFYILGIDIQSMFFGKRYTETPNPNDENRNRCYSWGCFFSGV